MTLDPKTVQASQRLKQALEKISQGKEKFAGASREFQNRYFSWCLEECKAEVERDFELVRMVQDISTCIFFDFVESLPQDTRKEVLVTLCKAMHALESLSRKEIEIYQRYRQHWSMPVAIGGRIVTGLRTTPRQSVMQERFLERSPSTRIMSHALRMGLKNTGVAEFGRVLLDKPSLLVYEKCLGSWYLVTVFEFGRYSQLRYSHHIHALPGGKAETRIFSGISILNWTGIHPDSTWSWLLPEDVADAIKAVQRICIHFIQQAERLLVNLPR